MYVCKCLKYINFIYIFPLGQIKVETIKHTKTYEKQPSRSNREIRAICIHMKTEKKIQNLGGKTTLNLKDIEREQKTKIILKLGEESK